MYIVFLVGDFSKLYDTTWLKYPCMLALFAYSFIEYKRWDLKHILFRVAYLFTLLADLFLLVINNYYVVGVSLFLVAQICYFAYLALGKDKNTILELLVSYAIILFIGGVILLFIIQNGSPLYFITLFYFALLIVNAASAYLNKEKEGIYPFIGFILFICCDICVGLNNMTFVLENNVLSYIVSIAMWLFYLPSQYLIVNSLDKIYTRSLHEEKDIK